MKLLGRVYLKSVANGKWVCAESGGRDPLIANRDNPSTWETFEVWADDGSIVPPINPPDVGAPIGPDQWHDYFMSETQRLGLPILTQDALIQLKPSLNRYGATWQNDIPWLGRSDYRPRIYFSNGDQSPLNAANPYYGRYVDVGEYGKPWVWIVRVW